MPVAAPLRHAAQKKEDEPEAKAAIDLGFHRYRFKTEVGENCFKIDSAAAELLHAFSRGFQATVNFEITNPPRQRLLIQVPLTRH